MSELIMTDHFITTSILDDSCCLCRRTIFGGHHYIVQIDDDKTSWTYELPMRVAHLTCAESSGAVTKEWSQKALQNYCDNYNDPVKRRYGFVRGYA